MSEQFITNINVDYIYEILHNRKFYFEYQPILNLKTNNVESYEALVRFDFNRKLKCNVQDFINIVETFCAEDFNEILYSQLLNDVDVFPVPIHFNLSSCSFKILDKIQQNDKVIFEITEDYIHSRENLEYLQQKINEGFKIGIDDFGKGYNSLCHFFARNVKFDFIKFDKSLITDIANVNKANALNKFRLAFEKDLGIDVIVEGVEKKEEFDILANLDFTYVQGYFVQKPQTLNRLLLLKYRKYIT